MSLLPDDLKTGPEGAPTGGAGSVPPKPPLPPAPPAMPPRPPVVPAAPLPPRPLSVAPQASTERPIFGGGLRVSLMPSDPTAKPAANIRKQLVVLALVIVMETLVMGGIYFYLLRTISGRTDEANSLAAHKAELQAQTKKQEETLKEAAVWNRQRKAAAEALDKHIYWTDLFAFLEANTLPTVSYRSFSADADTGIVTLDATSKGYRDLAEQIVLLRSKPQVLDVRTAAASAQVDDSGVITGVAFSVSLKLNPALWSFKK